MIWYASCIYMTDDDVMDKQTRINMNNSSENCSIVNPLKCNCEALISLGEWQCVVSIPWGFSN